MESNIKLIWEYDIPNVHTQEFLHSIWVKWSRNGEEIYVPGELGIGLLEDLMEPLLIPFFDNNKDILEKALEKSMIPDSPMENLKLFILQRIYIRNAKNLESSQNLLNHLNMEGKLDFLSNFITTQTPANAEGKVYLISHY